MVLDSLRALGQSLPKIQVEWQRIACRHSRWGPPRLGGPDTQVESHGWCGTVNLATISLSKRCSTHCRQATSHLTGTGVDLAKASRSSALGTHEASEQLRAAKWRVCWKRTAPCKAFCQAFCTRLAVDCRHSLAPMCPTCRSPSRRVVEAVCRTCPPHALN